MTTTVSKTNIPLNFRLMCSREAWPLSESDTDKHSIQFQRYYDQNDPNTRIENPKKDDLIGLTALLMLESAIRDRCKL